MFVVEALNTLAEGHVLGRGLPTLVGILVVGVVRLHVSTSQWHLDDAVCGRHEGRVV